MGCTTSKAAEVVIRSGQPVMITPNNQANGVRLTQQGTLLVGGPDLHTMNGMNGIHTSSHTTIHHHHHHLDSNDDYQQDININVINNNQPVSDNNSSLDVEHDETQDDNPSEGGSIQNNDELEREGSIQDDGEENALKVTETIPEEEEEGEEGTEQPDPLSELIDAIKEANEGLEDGDLNELNDQLEADTESVITVTEASPGQNGLDQLSIELDQGPEPQPESEPYIIPEVEMMSNMYDSFADNNVPDLTPSYEADSGPSESTMISDGGDMD